MRRALLLLPLACACALAQDGDQEQATAAQLEALRGEIKTIQQRIAQQTGERDELQRALRTAELGIAASDKALEQLEQKMADVLSELEALDTEAGQLAVKQTSLQRQMSDEIRHLWALRQGGGLRVLLGDQGPDRTARNLAYYQRLMTQRSEAVADYQRLLDAIETNRQRQLTAQSALANQRQQLEVNRETAVRLQSERREALTALSASLSRDSDRVAKLEADRQRLSQLLEELRSSIANLETPASYKRFAEAKRELQFPARGKPSNRFGAQRNSGSLRWQGWLIPAREGTDVRAVHHGRVVYSDWLRGQGLLMILDHGDGWLSLYGHNRSLQADVGDWVRPGDVIAKVGASGGNNSPALYFEIRKDGKPVDPGQWLRP